MNRRAAPGAAVAIVAVLSVGGCGSRSSPVPKRAPTSAVSPAPSVAVSGSAADGTTPRVSLSSPQHTQSTPAILVIHIRGYAYHPAAPVVLVGQRIQIVNDDDAAHTWSAAPGAGWRYTSSNLAKGQRATFAGFAKPGTYKFLCYYHAEMPAMNGTVTVHAR